MTRTLVETECAARRTPSRCTFTCRGPGNAISQRRVCCLFYRYSENDVWSTGTTPKASAPNRSAGLSGTVLISVHTPVKHVETMFGEAFARHFHFFCQPYTQRDAQVQYIQYAMQKRCNMRSICYSYSKLVWFLGAKDMTSGPGSHCRNWCNSWCVLIQWWIFFQDFNPDLWKRQHVAVVFAWPPACQGVRIRAMARRLGSEIIWTW